MRDLSVLSIGLVITLVVGLAADRDDFLARWFQQPPAVYRPLQIIHNFDGLGPNEEVRLKVLTHLKDLGVGGLVVNVSFNNYLRSEEQWRIFQWGMEAAKKLGFHLWLYDEEGYPSGAAGGLVLEGRPEFEARGLALVKDPTGKWTWQTKVMYEGTHCTENVYQKRRYPNILEKEAIKRFIEVTHQAYAQRFGNLGRLFRAVFTDEPSLMTTYIRPPEDAVPVIPWVSDLPDEFLRRKGY
ncbi:MAG: hypothetical protein NZ959_07575, partial [Armatimonadetes bacterium]|nr:hypothetical protein [Armatimonadota bacterium]MDW8122409.1 hypothetical protein [Armatimonadota bacterium]